jgi:hypothetical protein
MHTLRHAPRHAAPRRPVARFALAALAAGLAACGGGKDGPTAPSDNGGRDLAGSYGVTSVAGRPAPSVGLTGSFVLQSGNRWTMHVEDATGQIDDNGTYTASGSALTFRSARFGDTFTGTAADDNRQLAVRYDFGGANGVVTVVFNR